MTKLEKAKQLAKELKEMCQDPEICKKVADYFYDQDAERCDESLTDLAWYAELDEGERLEIQPRLCLPAFNITFDASTGFIYEIIKE